MISSYPKTIFITGSSRGIGAEVARLSKKNGFKVILHGRTKSNSLIRLSQELEAEYFYFDVKDIDSIENCFKKISTLDALVNSAGLNISKPFKDLTYTDWNTVYSTNVFGLVSVIQKAIPLLKKNKSLTRIVNIASIKGTYSSVGRVAYASSKAAVINITSGLAKEMAPQILVNSVSPGFTKTKMTDETWSERIEKQVNSILLKRVAKPHEIAEVIYFLCSEKCTYITGQNINVDGGYGIKDL
jgi:3-oxoacyl-[acyl-carrier protein] reductase